MSIVEAKNRDPAVGIYKQANAGHFGELYSMGHRTIHPAIKTPLMRFLIPPFRRDN